MSMSADKIVTEALALSPQARAFVAERLIESLDASPGSELSPAWREELRKRCREVDEGAVQLRDAADVFAKAYTSLE
jgi:putative addiction module component (TIGR02574 family)